jgi:ribonuclease HII
VAAGGLGDLALIAAPDRYERQLREQGFTRVAGVDEAGRGALAGPTVAAAMILPEGFVRDGVNDSKMLTFMQRQEAYERIVAEAVAYAIVRVEPSVIDRRGLHRCNVSLLRRAVRALDPAPEYALSDGFPVPHMPCPSLAIKKGDAVAVTVAAASILAKVTRDRIMGRLHKRHPGYGWDHNRGYGTPGHLDALAALGPTPVHRWSFAPVGQVSLFAGGGVVSGG